MQRKAVSKRSSILFIQKLRIYKIVNRYTIDTLNLLYKYLSYLLYLENLFRDFNTVGPKLSSRGRKTSKIYV